MSATRRAFLQGSAAAAAGLVLGFHVPELGAQPASDAVAFEPNAYLRIAPDGGITIAVIRQEMGQGVRTVLPMMVAEELEADWSRVTLEQAMPGGRFKGVRLHTSGSGSSSGAYEAMRKAGAAAREMLVAAAAAEWGVASDSCRARQSTVVHVPTGRTRAYGQLVSAAALLPVPAEPKLKDPSTFTLLGTPTKRVDGPDIVTGRAVYGIDVRVPGMLHATIERAPSFGAKLVRFDAARALATPGVLHVVPVTMGLHPGVAVVARDTFAALRGRQALSIEWQQVSPHGDFDSQRFLEQMPGAFARADARVRHEGDARAAIAGAARTLEATYVYPFQAHAPLETMNCTADVRADSAELWIPTQTAFRSMQQVVRVTGLPEDKVRMHCTLMGGGFGRRLFADFVAEACEVSKAVGAPVQVLWSREDDTRFGYFQPATAQRFTGGLDAGGRLLGLEHRTTASDLTVYDAHEGKPLWAAPAPAAEPPAPDRYERDEIPWGAFDNPYDIANLRVDCADVTSPVPTGPWRAVMYPSTVFGRESFLDELAHAAGKDPLRFRLELLPPGVKTVGSYAIDRGRLARALEEVARRSSWDAPLPPLGGRLRGRGVAANVYHAGSYVAMVAEVSVARDLSDLRVHRVVIAVDCGRALNPLGIEGQAESGIAWGLSAALHGKIDFRKGRAVQSSYADCEVMRIDRMPAVEVFLIPSDAAPGGFGEHPVPHVAPAVASAVFAATGKRVRTLPITPDALRSA